MATTQNGMRSPWQQTWRGEFSGDGGGGGGGGGACAGLWSFGRPHHSTDSYLKTNCRALKAEAFKNQTLPIRLHLQLTLKDKKHRFSQVQHSASSFHWFISYFPWLLIFFFLTHRFQLLGQHASHKYTNARICRREQNDHRN